MKKIIPLSPDEERIVLTVKGTLKHEGLNSEHEAVVNNEGALYELASAISKYPSILGVQSLGGASRSVETLVDTLQVQDPMDLILHIPTKALLGKGFSFAKINFFYMIYYLLQQETEETLFPSMVMDVISSNVFTLMAEEVFLSIISDRAIPEHIRRNAGYLLANIWEYRIDHGVSEFAPVLNNIWTARKRLRPAYGTMLGISELFKISESSSKIWVDYLQRDRLCSEEVDAMQEFLLGLSFEEMRLLNENMERTGKTSLGSREIDIILGERKAYPDYLEDDPRELFKSYRHRHKNAQFRFKANRDGPKKTLEEYIMCYLLARPEEWSVADCAER
ncbi:MAG TPA: hypothetical protein PK926_04770 [Spirochaetota bacterium]|nr:hypothetical protein [Spirochaetota bacterium]HPI88892.1 hypothetical protein [Spirochaetota bacterium]HPR46978.1 hypothetical protein [Spirochaetota bacterium]